jgi:DNA invertase Pin-like site-specific DNA recombinase
MTKITPDHLGRSAFVYIRQSTTDQVLNNHESRRRQYGLAERARQLGWQDVVVIDDDLGRSGSGVTRPGFERLLAAICEGRAGAVFAIEASRLARNGRDWHTLIEFCGLVGAIIIDEDGVYEPRHPNDRLLLGMKGTMSELELSILRQRSVEALKQKARRPGDTRSPFERDCSPRRGGGRARLRLHHRRVRSISQEGHDRRGDSAAGPRRASRSGHRLWMPGGKLRGLQGPRPLGPGRDGVRGRASP